MSRIYGTHAVLELLETAPHAVTSVHLVRGRRASEDEPVVAKAEALGIPIQELDPSSQRARSGGRGGVRVAADIRIAQAPALEEIGAEGAPLVLALDGVTDPHNLGAIVRSSAALGASLIIVPRDNAAPLNDAAVRASAGAVAHVPVMRVVNLARALRQLREQGLWALAAIPDAGTSLWDADLTLPTVLALGAEGRGLRPGVVKACEVTVRLPLAGPVASLNVSVFAGIALAEATRQRHAARPLDKGA